MNVLTSTEISCTVYIVNASEILEKKIKKAEDTKIDFCAVFYVPKSHFAAATAGVSDCDTFEKQIKYLIGLDSVRTTVEEKKVQSVVQYEQTFCNKFQKTL